MLTMIVAASLMASPASPVMAERSTDAYYSEPGGDLEKYLAFSSQLKEVRKASDNFGKSLDRLEHHLKVANKRQQYARSYPAHAVSWHIVGSAETKPQLIQHLMTHPEHRDVRRVFFREDLNLMSRGQLMALHDDSHNRRLHLPTMAVASAQKVMSGYNYAESGCPGGKCPSASASRRAAKRMSLAKG